MTGSKKQEVVGILDRSGSMAGKVEDAVGGFNSTLEVLRQEKTDDCIINVSVKLFDNMEEMLIRSIPLADVRPLETRQFVPRGQTALLDAIGNTLTFFMEKKLMDPQAYDCCSIYVVTDGKENCSKTFTRQRIKELIRSADQTYNIKVIYLAANQDAILEAGNIGINAGQAINYSESQEETRAAYRSAAAIVGRHRSGGRVEFLEVERRASQNSTSLPTTYPATVLNPATPPFRVSPPPIIRQDSNRRMYTSN